MKSGSITMIQRLKPSQCSGSTWTQQRTQYLQRRQKCSPFTGMVMLTIFWDQDRVVMIDFLAKYTTITRASYASLLRKLREAIKIKKQGKISKGIFLLQDNTMLWFTTYMLPDQKHGRVAMKSSPIPCATILQPIIFISSQSWSCFWMENISQIMQPSFPKSHCGWRTNLGCSTKTVSRAASNDGKNA